MSRFWGGSSSESESEEDRDLTSASESEEEEEEEEQTQKQARRSIFDRESSDEEEAERRVVRSQKDKRLDFLNAAIKAIQNHLKINDWVAISNEWENLTKGVATASRFFEKSGVPKIFLKCFAELEDAMEAAWNNKEARDKMSAANKKSLGLVRQKLRKEKTQYETQLAAWRANPVEDEEEEEEEEVESAEETEEESAEEDNEGFKKVSKKPKKGAKKDEAEGEDAFVPENVEKKLLAVIASRGRKNTDTKKQLEILRKLVDLADTPLLRARVMFTLVSTHFDNTISMVHYLAPEIWKAAVADLLKLFDLLDANSTIIIREDVVDELSDDEEEADEKPDLADDEDEDATRVDFRKTKQKNRRSKAEAAENPNLQYITGSLVSIAERLDDEFIKSLQHIDPHTIDYIERLRDETELYEVLVRTQRYYERIDRVDPYCRTLLRRVEHIYFKNQTINDSLEKKILLRIDPKSEEQVDTSALMHKLCTFLYKNANDRIRTRALLCHVYHHAIHDRFYKARDMLLMSHLQETIQHTDINTQILYNRTMVQIGLCAFRHGLMRDAQNAIGEIQASGRVKELLAQGSHRSSDKNQEQEKLEKQRQIPFHMHINLELLECVYMTCSMLLEIPAIAMNNYDTRRRTQISKPFRRLLDFIDRQIFYGPPENTREHIMQASKALMQGDWERSRDLITSIKIWDLIPNKAQILEMLSKRLQEEGLRTYLFTFSQFYDSLSLQHLANMFKLTTAGVHSIVSKMIINDEIHASLDQVSGVVVLHRAEPNKLQFTAVHYTEKLAALVDSNDRMFELRAGNFRDERRDKRPGRRDGQTGGTGREQGKEYTGRSRTQGGRSGQAGGDERRERTDQRGSRGGDRQQRRGGNY